MTTAEDGPASVALGPAFPLQSQGLPVQSEAPPSIATNDPNANRTCLPQAQVVKAQKEEYAREKLCVYRYNGRGASVPATVLSNAPERTWRCPTIMDTTNSSQPLVCKPSTRGPGFYSQPRVAWAFSGGARSFRQTAPSLQHQMILPFGGKPSVIMHLALRDDGGKDRDGYRGLKSLHAKLDDLVPAFNLLKPRMLALRERSAICNANCSCSNPGFLGHNFHRVLNQLNGIARTWDMMEQLESEDRQKFDVVIRVRFDMFWLDRLQEHCFFHSAHAYTALHNTDMFFMASRQRAAARFLVVNQYHQCRGDFQHCSTGGLHAWLSTGKTITKQMGLPFAIHRGSECQPDSKVQCSSVTGLKELGWKLGECMQTLYGEHYNKDCPQSLGI